MKFKLFGRLKKDSPGRGAPSADEIHTGRSVPYPKASSRPLPEERVTFLASQGLAEPEIIKALKDEGYSFQEIDSGVTNVLKLRVSNEPVSFDAPLESPQNEDLAPVFHPNSPEVMREEAEQQKRTGFIEEMEEIMETLIEEKFSRVVDELEKIDKRYSESNEKIRQLSDRLAAFENLEKTSDSSVVERMNSVSAKEETIEPRVASLEKAFKDIIPNLVDSIREIRETVASAKQRGMPVQIQDIGNAMDETGAEDEAEKSEKSIFD